MTRWRERTVRYTCLRCSATVPRWNSATTSPGLLQKRLDGWPIYQLGGSSAPEKPAILV